MLATFHCSSAGPERGGIADEASSAAVALGLGARRPSTSYGALRLQVVAVPARLSTARSIEALDYLIDAAAHRFGHEADLLRAMIRVESNFKVDAVSHKGAIGLMQVMPNTARSLGVEAPERSLFDPHTNVMAGARYLRLLFDRFAGQPELAIAAYNAGEGAVIRYGGIPPYAETRTYVRRVKAQYRAYRDTSDNGVTLSRNRDKIDPRFLRSAAF
jgi:soluble lytic murein transglycosylase-like protein